MKVIVVVKKSTWEQYHQNSGAFGRMNPSSLKRARSSHDRQEKSAQVVYKTLEGLGIKPWIVSGAETAFNAENADLVIALGGDGTLLSASHHVGSKPPLLGINSDPVFSRGHFCAATAANAGPAIMSALKKPKIKKVTRLEIKIGKVLVSKRVLNEALFSHTCPAAMTRLTLGKDRFACSGVWIGTGAGSTGAIASAGGTILDPTSRWLQAVIREHCGAKPGKSPTFLHSNFVLTSKTPDATLYLDGPFLRVPVSYDEKVTFKVSPDHLSLVV